MERQEITFDKLPNAVYELGLKVDQLTTLMSGFAAPHIQQTKDCWMTIEELSAYLPGRPAVSTLYNKVQRRELPHKRMGKRLAFLKSEIDQWLKGLDCKTQTQINEAAEQYVLANKKRRKQ